MQTCELLQIPGNRHIIGTQYGDEGKGKGTNSSETDMYGRGNGGRNAGHTFVGENGEEINTHLLPSAINIPGKFNVIGHGTYVDPVGVMEEIQEVREAGYQVSPENLAISSMAHIVMPRHIALDSLNEQGAGKQGTTKRGIAFVAADKMRREGIRGISLLNESPADLKQLAYEGLRSWIVTDQDEYKPVTQQVATKEAAEEGATAFVKAVEQIKPYITETSSLVQTRLADGQTITAEGAQAFGLDINRGKYPYVTSSDTLVMGLASGLGLNHKQIGVAIGVAKAIQSKVGGGKMITEETDPRVIDILRGKRGEIDAEFGKSSERPRDVGNLDLVLLKIAAEANGLDMIVLNKLDVLNRYVDSIKVAIAYELDGKTLTTLPEDVKDLERCTPVYHEFAPFTEDIGGETDYDKLPKTLKNYVEFCEDYVGVPFAMLGTGPANDHVICR